MTAPQSNLDAEREIDLARWRAALRRLWWLVTGGLVVGAVIGALIGLLLGAILAVVADGRTKRVVPA